MPGIAGIITKRDDPRVRLDLVEMIGCMMHEPFYKSGSYINQNLGVYTGWVCHEGSFSDCMPIVNEKGNLAVLYAGENFLDEEKIGELKSKGHQVDSSSASYLVHLYEEEGDAFFRLLNGWFAGVVIDERTGKTILFNDRYAMHRIYYHESEDEFIFSSEAKSILRIRPHLRVMDMRSLGEYFSCGCVLENRTLFSGILLLPGASAWIFENGKCREKENYFEVGLWETQPQLSHERFLENLIGTFRSIVPKYFQAK